MTDAIREKTGLVIDAYFSGTKLRWLLDNVPGARARAERGELAFGTVDSWLMWQLTGGKVHVTDVSNASRTMLFNVHSNDWDADLLKALDIPAALLPEVQPVERALRRHRRRRCSAAPADRRRGGRPAEPPSSARPASQPAWPRTPTAPAASC